MDILAEIDWQPLLEGGDGPPLLAFFGMGIVTIAVVGLVQWRRVRIGEAEVSLKMRMIERRYSPEQIAQVMSTKIGIAKRWRCRDDKFLTPASA